MLLHNASYYWLMFSSICQISDISLNTLKRVREIILNPLNTLFSQRIR